MEDRALVRAMSSALVNRVLILNIRSDVAEWLVWAAEHGVRDEIIAFIGSMPDALMRGVPAAPVSFSTPRAWASLSQALDATQQAGVLDREIRRALAFGCVSAEDASVFCTMAEEGIEALLPIREYLQDPAQLPEKASARWFVLARIRVLVARGELSDLQPEVIHRFLMAIPRDHLFALFVNLVREWGALGADDVMVDVLREVTGV